MQPIQETAILSSELRASLANHQTLGCGNFLRIAVETNPRAGVPAIFLERECRTFLGEVFESFSLSALQRVCDEYAAWYFGAGIRPLDPVAVYLEDGIEYLIHYVALTALGAIPILINGQMKPEIAAGFVQKTGAVALFGDPVHQKAISKHFSAKFSLRFNLTDDTALTLGRGSLPATYPYRHSDDSPVLIGHSSGTTGIPKAVLFAHQQFFYGIRYRLSLPAQGGQERLVSALPHSHSAGIAYLMLALLSGNQLLIMSDHTGEAVLPYLEEFKATMVAAFPETFVGLSECDLEAHDLSSIRLWVNGGDAAHESHIRRLVGQGQRMKEGRLVPGSIFVDGLGSSEMGFSLFRNVHTPETDHYDRCIGQPLEWVDAQVIGDDGEILPPGKVGRLGVKSPSLTPGYWNDSLLNLRARIQGYWLTGDLFYRDEQNRFFHVDRTPDAIRTPEGMVYSLQTEELLLKHCGDLLIDCTVVGAQVDKEYFRAVAVIQPKPEVRNFDREALLKRFNSVLKDRNLRTLSAVVVADPKEVPTGPTGKVLKRELRDKFRHPLSGLTETFVERGIR
jgi:acyl-CoA synthetase (AMP-forming)/AMP-acid ligase II